MGWVLNNPSAVNGVLALNGDVLLFVLGLKVLLFVLLFIVLFELLCVGKVLLIESGGEMAGILTAENRADAALSGALGEADVEVEVENGDDVSNDELVAGPNMLLASEKAILLLFVDFIGRAILPATFARPSIVVEFILCITKSVFRFDGASNGPVDGLAATTVLVFLTSGTLNGLGDVVVGIL